MKQSDPVGGVNPNVRVKLLPLPDVLQSLSIVLPPPESLREPRMGFGGYYVSEFLQLIGNIVLFLAIFFVSHIPIVSEAN